MAEQKYQIKLREPGIFLMPPIARFGKADNDPEEEWVWVLGSTPDSVRVYLPLSRLACRAFLAAENTDVALLQSDLEDVEVVRLPEDLREAVFPFFLEYKGPLSVNKTGYIVEFSGIRHDQRFLVSLSPNAYKGLLYHLKKLFARDS